jgi:hypothetical protein
MQLGIKAGRLMRKIKARRFGDFLETEPIARDYRFARGCGSDWLVAFGYTLDHQGRGEQSEKKNAQHNT